MSAAQLAILLRAVHAYNDQYAANGNSCYWYVFVVMEIIRTVLKDSKQSYGAQMLREIRGGQN
jgi:hypothetical protein